MRSKVERAALYRRRAKNLRRLAETTAGDAVTVAMLYKLAADYEGLAHTLDEPAAPIRIQSMRTREARTWN